MRIAQGVQLRRGAWADDHLALAASSDRQTFEGVPATARKEVTDGSIAATFWVGDADWGDGCSGAGPCVTQEMVDAMASRFLRTGDGNDIYDWLTAIFGAPWGPHRYSNVIPAEAAQHIHVLLYDIRGDGVPSAGQCRILGTQLLKHVFLNEEPGDDSAERLILFLDAPLYASPAGDSWELTDYWPSRQMGALVHVFQHLIHYYQKSIVHGVFADTWLNQMASEVAQDLIADKLMVDGPRGVAHDDPTAGTAGIELARLPYYNLFNDISVTKWRNNGANYAVVYAFGTYLARTYGAELFQKMVQTRLKRDAAVEGALKALGHNVSFGQALADWGVANLLSDDTGAPSPYRYNAGTWTNSQVGGDTFRLGSINLYNYRFEPGENPKKCIAPNIARLKTQEGPYLHSLNTFHAKALAPHSNRYATLGRHTGTVRLKVATPADTRITLVVKE